MILETNQVVNSIYASIGNYVVAAVLAAIGYLAKKKYDKYAAEQEKLEQKKAEYNEYIIKTVKDLSDTQKDIIKDQKEYFTTFKRQEESITKIANDLVLIRKDYSDTLRDNEETRIFMIDYFMHFDKLISDYNKTKDAVINIQENLKQDKKYHLTVELKREFFPSLKDTHLGFHQKNTNIA